MMKKTESIIHCCCNFFVSLIVVVWDNPRALILLRFAYRITSFSLVYNVLLFPRIAIVSSALDTQFSRRKEWVTLGGRQLKARRTR